MTIADVVEHALSEWPTLVAEDGGVLVPTHCLYPSNGGVTVVVHDGIGSYFVHDRWGALEDVAAAGASVTPARAAAIVRHSVTRYGLAIDNTGLIKAERVSPVDLLNAIVLVANASSDAANELLKRFRPRARRDLNSELATLLETRFPHHVTRDQVFVGASNKSHRVDHVVRVRQDRQIILDVVTREATSINAALVTHLDIRNARHADIEQRIIYDDEDVWEAADLSLLRIGATPVPFSRASEVLERLAA